MNADGVPAVFISNNGPLQVLASINQSSYLQDFKLPSSIGFNTWTNIAISQVFSGSQYIYRIEINGRAVFTKSDIQAQQFYNVTVYASNPWEETLYGYIKNFLFINGNANINECTKSNPVCSWSNGVCSNTNGSFVCSCNVGWMLGVDNASCVDINECTKSNPACSWSNGVCSNTNGSFVCSCNVGWMLGVDNASCVDINECTTTNTACFWSNGVCSNTNGSYICSCNMGWMLGVDNASCVDVDECSSAVPPCSWSNGVCLNTLGSFICSCKYLWILGKDNASCVDKCNNACIYKYKNETYSGPCNYGTQINTNYTECFDVSECIQNNICSWNQGVCINSIGKFKCLCNDGWTLTKTNDGCTFEYIPFNDNVLFKVVILYVCRLSNLEDLVNLTNCYPAGEFNPNTTKQFRVGDKSYASSRNKRSLDLNNSCNCPLNSNCTINDNFGCTCNPGYSSNYISTCQANDQCQGKCMKPHQFCQNIFSNLSYTCLCRSGYEKIGDKCKAINASACSLSLMKNISLCPSDQQCYDTNSSFECRCQTGNVKNELDYCQDVNECEENISACQSNAYCTNTNGSYYCQCNKGFIGENVSNSSTMRCYTNSAWSSWEQIGTCSMLCATDEKQGRLKFQRFCEAVQFSNCNGDYFKEELCNSQLCDNKITILKSPDCEKWSNKLASVSDESLKNNETWLNKIKAWRGWKPKACGPSLDDASKLLNQDIENINKEMNCLLADRNTLRKAIGCNAYIQRKMSLQTQYVSIYSRLVMYTTMEAALEKLKGRINLKLNECTRGLSAMYF